MLKSNLFVVLLATLLCACQTTEKNDSEVQVADNNTEVRSTLEGEIYEFTTAKLIYYPIYESSALYLGNAENEVVRIFKLQGFLSYDNIYLNGSVKFGEQFVEIQSANLPNAYFVFDTYLDQFSELVSLEEDEYLNSEGYGLAARNALPQHAELSYSDMISELDVDGGDIYNINVPCDGSTKIGIFCSSGGCGSQSCRIGGNAGGFTIEAGCACEVECRSGYFACCKDCEGCGCFKEACCGSTK